MPQLTTGIIENTAPFAGANAFIRPTQTLTVKITNDDPNLDETIQIEGYFVTGASKTLYVLELFILSPGEVAARNYFANLDEFEFKFSTSSAAVEISVWGKDASGNLTTAQRIVPAELDPIP